MKQLLFFILLVFSQPTLFSNDPVQGQIEWAVFDKAPYFILKGTLRGEGINDGLLQFIQQRLTDFKHKIIHMNPSNYLHEVQYNKNLCLISLHKNKALEKILHFSQAITLYLPPRLIMKVDTAQFSDVSEEISITELFHNPDLSGALELGRSYRIGALIPKELDDSNFTFVKNGASSIFQKLLDDEINYMIDTPMMMNYLKYSGGEETELISIPIWEIPTHQLGYVNCTKNSWGEKIIREIDKILKKEQKSKEFKKIVERWLSPNERKRFHMLYGKHVLTKSKP